MHLWPHLKHYTGAGNMERLIVKKQLRQGSSCPGLDSASQLALVILSLAAPV